MVDTDVMLRGLGQFLSNLISRGEVWGLRNGHGWASTRSNVKPDCRAIPFWSTREHAESCAREEWAEYRPTAIPLELFVTRWLPGMAGDSLVAGLDWSAALVGPEADPEQLRRQIGQEMMMTPSA